MTTRAVLARWAGAIGGAAILLAAPAIYAQTTNSITAETSSTAEIAAEESVVIAPSDEPLLRASKFRRAWVVYRELGTKQIWAITMDKTKREIKTLDFFTAFEANYHIQLVAKGRLDAFPTGSPITTIDGLTPDLFRKRPFECRLVKSATNTAVYLICHGKKRVILREGVFHRFGWEFRDVETVTQAELDQLQTEASVDDSTVFEEEVTVDSTEKRMERERLTKRLDLRGKDVVRKRLVKAIGKPDVYVITPDGRRHHIKDLTAAQHHGLDLKATTEVTVEELEAFPEGSEITAASSSAELNTKVDTSVR